NRWGSEVGVDRKDVLTIGSTDLSKLCSDPRREESLRFVEQVISLDNGDLDCSTVLRSYLKQPLPARTRIQSPSVRHDLRTAVEQLDDVPSPNILREVPRVPS